MHSNLHGVWPITSRITLSAAILILCLAVLVLRFGSSRFNERDPVEK